MKKTLTANISGTVFHIEEDAYEALNRYLGNIRSRFAGTAGREDIMADIEARIAELFGERLDGRRQVVNIGDVEHVIGVMGQPEDYTGDDGTEDTGASASGPWSGGPRTERRRRRLMRDTEDRWVGGVLSGIAAYFGIDPLILRIVYIALLLVGVGWLIYLILWVVVPPAETAAERLAMRGEPVNVENIKRMFEEGGERLKSGAERMAHEVDERWNGPDARSRQEHFRQSASRGMRNAVGVLGRIIGIGLLIMGTIFGIMLIGGIAGGGTLLHDELVGGEGIDSHELGGLIFSEPQQATWFFIGLVLLCLIPVAGLIMAGVRLVFNIRSPRWLPAGMGIAWGVALVLVIVMSVRLGNDFKRSEPLRAEHPLVQPTGSTLYLDAKGKEGASNGWTLDIDNGRAHWDGKGFNTTSDSLHGGWAELDVVRSPDSLFHLVVERRAQARSAKASLVRAAHIMYGVEQQDSTLRFSPWLHFPKGDLFRAQRLRFVVQVPSGKAVHLGHGIGHMLDDVKNVTNTYDDDMTGRTWTMTDRGLMDLSAPAHDERWDHDSDPDNTPSDPVKPVHTTVAAVVWKATQQRKRSLPVRRTQAEERSTPPIPPAPKGSLVPNLLPVLFAHLH